MHSAGPVIARQGDGAQRAGDDHIASGLRRLMEANAWDALVVIGDDNFAYLTGAALPFGPESPDRRAVAIRRVDGQSCIVCPYDWADAIRDQGWQSAVRIWDELAATPPDGLLSGVTQALKEMDLVRSRVGVDLARMPHLIATRLRAALPDLVIEPADAGLVELRMIKSLREVSLLEVAAAHAQKAIVSALNHAEGTVDAISYTVAEFAERVRVHVGEFGGDATGHLAAMQGRDASVVFVPPCGVLSSGNLLRIEVTNMHAGYWANSARTVVVGEPTREQAAAYRDNIALKAVAVEQLRPGVGCADVFAAVRDYADRHGNWFWQEVGVGHGIGTSEREAPYLAPTDKTRLAPGMTLVVAVYTRGPEGELIVSKDSFEIVAGGCRLLSWYRNWDRLYAITGVSARHG